MFLAGLAQVWQARVGAVPAAAADSSRAATIDGETPQGLELFQQLGGQVRTEEVAAE